MELSFLPFQFILFSFLLFAFSRVVLRFREGTISVGIFLFWSAIWLLATVGILEPQFTTFVANKLGIGRGADAIIYLSLLLLYYLVYRTNVQIENIREEITKLARMIALSKEKNTKKDSGGKGQR